MSTTVKEEFARDGGLKAAGRIGAARTQEESLPRVVFVIAQSGNLSNGGVESITQVLEGLRRVEPVVVTQLETPVNGRWVKRGAKVLLWPMKALRPWSLLRANLRMFRLLRSTGARVVHCNDIFALWHTGFGARLGGARVLFNVRNIKPVGARYGWRWRVAKVLSHRQLVLSREMQSRLALRLGINDASTRERQAGIEYIYSAVDTRRLYPFEGAARMRLRKRLKIDAGCFAIGYVGTFEPRKGQLDFIREAGPRLKERLPRAKVYFIGDFNTDENEYARECLQAVRDLKLEETFAFMGHRREVADWYRATDLSVVASRNEGLARCMIESLACATPVVSFDVCSAREILEERGCGLVVPEGDYEALVKQVTTLAHQEDALKQLGGAGARVARELFDPQEVVRRYEHLYLALNGN
jgi:glycosyltransferase involved in cell wall biosynthesis